MLHLQVSDAEDVLRLLISINVKDKKCDLFQVYIYLSLVENWLLFDTMLKDKAVVKELWGVCLRNCSCGITITDLRSYASNVSNKCISLSLSPFIFLHALSSLCTTPSRQERKSTITTMQAKLTKNTLNFPYISPIMQVRSKASYLLQGRTSK